MPANTDLRATPEDERIIQEARREGESTSEVIRRALRLLAREVWMGKARADAERLADEDLSIEKHAW